MRSHSIWRYHIYMLKLMKARCNNLFLLQTALTTLQNGLLKLQSRSFLGERLVFQYRAWAAVLHFCCCCCWPHWYHCVLHHCNLVIGRTQERARGSSSSRADEYKRATFLWDVTFVWNSFTREAVQPSGSKCYPVAHQQWPEIFTDCWNNNI